MRVLVSTVAPCSRCRAFRPRWALPRTMRAYISSGTWALGPANNPRATTTKTGATCSVSALFQHFWADMTRFAPLALAYAAPTLS